MRQLGNAVPVRLGQVVASSVAEHLLRDDERRAVAALKTDRDHGARGCMSAPGRSQRESRSAQAEGRP